MSDITIKSYAKINLTLEILSKRADGYHDLDSVVQVIDVFDTMDISKMNNGGIEVKCDHPWVPDGQDNLVYKICSLFLNESKISSGLKVNVNKNVPVQAGMGGGSANAASVLIGLNKLFECGYNKSDLARMASAVSSDAPLFIYGGTVRMKGRGEVIEQLPDAPELSLVIVKPEGGVSTRWAYSQLDRDVNRKYTAMSDKAFDAIVSKDKTYLMESLYNDFDEIVCGMFDDIAQAKRMMIERSAIRTMLCGSGSAVFGVFESDEAAQKAAEDMKDNFAQVIVTRSLNRDECYG